jgi:hypothetical protein
MIAVCLARFGRMAVDAVVGGVERAVLEPFDRDVAGVGRVLDLAERLDPVDALGLLAPEAVRVFHRALIHLLVLGFVDEAALLPLGWNLVDLVVGHRLLHALRQVALGKRAILLVEWHYAMPHDGVTRHRTFHFGRLIGVNAATSPIVGLAKFVQNL